MTLVQMRSPAMSELSSRLPRQPPLPVTNPTVEVATDLMTLVARILPTMIFLRAPLPIAAAVL